MTQTTPIWVDRTLTLGNNTSVISMYWLLWLGNKANNFFPYKIEEYVKKTENLWRLLHRLRFIIHYKKGQKYFMTQSPMEKYSVLYNVSFSSYLLATLINTYKVFFYNILSSVANHNYPYCLHVKHFVYHIYVIVSFSVISIMKINSHNRLPSNVKR